MGTSGSSALVDRVCPYCAHGESGLWAVERGFKVVRCSACDFLYLNPVPGDEARDEAVRSGAHGASDDMDISERHVPKKTALYRNILGAQFSDVWAAGRPVTWMDVGAGYGEIVEAVTSLAPAGSKIIGVEPMRPKALAAQARGLNIINDYVGPSTPKCNYASVVNVFSHINDFGKFIGEVRDALSTDGEIFVETGNAADLALRTEFPGTLGLPDHVAFAGEKHIIGFLRRHGFEIISVRRDRIDGLAYTAKNLVKRIIGRDVHVKLPYASNYRTLRVRARKLAG